MAKTNGSGVYKFLAGAAVTVLVAGFSVGGSCVAGQNSAEHTEIKEVAADHGDRLRTVETGQARQEEKLDHVIATVERIEAKLDR